MTATAPTEGLARALDATGAIVAGIRDDQWSNPTPCTDWDVRTLLNHLVVGNGIFVNSLAGEAPTPEALRQMRTMDALGNDPVGAYNESAGALLDAFNRPGVLERMVDIPAGRVPGMAALHIRITETLTHGWDLARATGQPADLPEDLAEAELAFSRGRGETAQRTGHPFGPEQPAAEDASAIDRLAAYLGRPVDFGSGNETA